MCQKPWLWNWGRSFRFRQQILCGTLPSGKIKMTSYPSQITSYNGTLSGSHGHSLRTIMKNRLKRPLADKSRWRYIRFAIKPRSLETMHSRYKCRYGTLSGSLVRSFRIRREKSPEAPPSEEITMTSSGYNKTSLSGTLCILDKKLLWITIKKSCSLFQNSIFVGYLVIFIPRFWFTCA